MVEPDVKLRFLMPNPRQEILSNFQMWVEKGSPDNDDRENGIATPWLADPWERKKSLLFAVDFGMHKRSRPTPPLQPTAPTIRTIRTIQRLLGTRSHSSSFWFLSILNLFFFFFNLLLAVGIREGEYGSEVSLGTSLTLSFTEQPPPNKTEDPSLEEMGCFLHRPLQSWVLVQLHLP